MRIFLLLAVCVCFANKGYSQYPLDNKRDWQWRFGYDNNPPNWGLTKIDFSSGVPVSSYDIVPFDFYNASASICDTSGQLVFYSNGARVANRFEQQTPNGDSIGCCTLLFTQEMNIGGTYAQTHLFLPVPDQPNGYVLLKKTIDYGADLYGNSLQVNYLDASVDSGNGDVVLKNSALLSDTFDINGITACRHANGRDWWIVDRHLEKAKFFVYLVNPLTTELKSVQEFDLYMPQMVGQVFFTPDGNTLVYTTVNNYESDSAYIYRFGFDRCEGVLTDLNRIVVSSPSGALSMGGTASPSSRFIYGCFYNQVYQFDLQATDLLASQVLVATYDGFMDSTGSFPKPTGFTWMQLGPDGKIYITAGNTSYLHVIENPDELGIACNVNQHAFHLSTLNNYSIPNFPNFRLGPIDGSDCDTLGIDLISNISHLPNSDFNLSLHPNPGFDQFTCTYNQLSHQAVIEVYDAVGRLQLSVPARATSTVVSTKSLPAGFYCVKLMSEGKPLAKTRWVKTQ